MVRIKVVMRIASTRREPKEFTHTAYTDRRPYDAATNATQALRNDVWHWAPEAFREVTGAPNGADYTVTAEVNVGEDEQDFEIRGLTDGGLGSAISQAATSLHGQVAEWAAVRARATA